MQSTKNIEAALASAKALVATLEAALAEPSVEPDSRALTLEAAAALTGVSAHTLRSWARAGRLASFRGARGAYLVTRAQLDAAITARPSVPRATAAPTDIEAWERAANATLRLVGGR